VEQKKDYRVYVNLDYCIDCKSCEVACANSHNVWHNLSRGYVEEIAGIPQHCRHCKDAACVAACPQDAMYRDENGIVRRKSFQCTGCMSCAIACPFGAINPELIRHTISKCDLCITRLEEGEVPACVATCTTGALEFRKLDETYKEKTVLGARSLGKLIRR